MPAPGTGEKRGAAMKKRKGFAIRGGPLGMSLAAAALTAVAFAAVSLADSGSSDGSGTDEPDFHAFRAPAPGGPVERFKEELSEADRQKLEDFRQCMENSGAPAPPEPGEIDPPDGPPKPPSEEDIDELRQAWEGCQDKLPEGLQKAGPPMLHFEGCEPGRDDPGNEERGEREDQSDDSGTSSSGATT
jgi:hypothetical protein